MTAGKENFPIGIVGADAAGLGSVERQVPAGEPPPLAVNAALQVIGKKIVRQDGRAKVTGAVRFTVDVKLDGLLHARIVRSDLPHARVRAINTDAAARAPGVRAVLVIAPPDSIVRYVGAPIAAVTARSMSRMADAGFARSGAAARCRAPICSRSSRMFCAPAPEADW